MVYTLLVGYPPFQTDCLKTTYKRIKNNCFAFPDHVRVSQEAKDLINGILVTDPQKRFGLDTIFAHDFFSKSEIPANIPVSSLAVPPKHEFLQGKVEKNDIGELSTSSSEEIKVVEGTWVEKWVKHDQMVGYVLNNSLIGANFADDTYLIGNIEEFYYIDSKKKAKYRYQKFPGNIKTKVAFLRYCCQYFGVSSCERIDEKVYVKKFFGKKHADCFKIGVNTVQFIFSDKSQVILLNGNQEIVYINKADQKSSYLFSEIHEITNKDLITRLRYTHSIMKSL